MGVINGVVICNGTNPPRRRKGDKRLNPLSPEFVPKNLESTPPSSGETAFAVPHYPPHLGPCVRSFTSLRDFKGPTKGTIARRPWPPIKEAMWPISHLPPPTATSIT
ncbi:hypothetical protein N0V85_000791 [Neurospora sp. IMI 360204]|nr:hypothetical protein N0V85_000791 [Neurospora sp. IMI 360204]